MLLLCSIWHVTVRASLYFQEQLEYDESDEYSDEDEEGEEDVKDARKAPWLTACAAPSTFDNQHQYQNFVSNLLDIFDGDEDKICFGVP